MINLLVSYRELVASLNHVGFSKAMSSGLSCGRSIRRALYIGPGSFIFLGGAEARETRQQKSLYVILLRAPLIFNIRAVAVAG